jgi:endo-1,4-beta-xylanase
MKNRDNHGGHGVLGRVVILFLVVSFFSCNGFIEEPQDWQEARPLHEIYKDDFLLLGNVISFPRDLENDRFILLKRHFNTVTAENHMKPENIVSRTQPWVYTYNNADNIVRTAREAGMNVVGHTLIWHNQTPPWLTTGTRAEVTSNLNKYITDVATHFKGKLISWDVVNEAMRDNLSASDAMNWSGCLRNSGWNNIGPDYIEKAFLAVQAADPDVKRYYNDYSLNNPNKRDAVYNMVKDINGRYPKIKGRPLIEGIGMQSHHHLGTNPETVEDSIEKFYSLGVEIAISELDIIAAGKELNGAPWNEKAAEDQAKKYAAMFKIFIKHSDKIERVTFWGIDDGTHWRTLDGSGAHAALLDADLKLKPAFYAVMDPYKY